MKPRILFVAASAIAVAACSSSPTGPSALPADPIPNPHFEDTTFPPKPRYEDTVIPPKP